MSVIRRFRELLYSVMATLFIVVSAFAVQWEPIHLELPATGTYRDLYPFDSKSPRLEDTSLSQILFSDSQYGWIVGSDGLIWRTQDGGHTWLTQSSPTTAWLSAVTFLDRYTGWAVGEQGTIIHTVDGGQQWYVQRSRTDEWLTDVFFLDPWQGWAVGRNVQLLRTQNGGRTWEEVSIHSVNGDFTAISFATPQHGWIVGRTLDTASHAILLVTTDGGDSWEDRSGFLQDIPALWSLTFRDEREGIMVGDQGTILRTQDQGVSWYWTTAPTHRSLLHVTYDHDGTIWIVGQGGVVLRSKDSGWQVESTPVRRLLMNVTTVAGSTWIVGNGPTVWRSSPEPSTTPEGLASHQTTERPYLPPDTENTDETSGVGVVMASVKGLPGKTTLEPKFLPRPRLLWVIVPEKVELGVPFTVDIAAINEGGTAAQGSISVSLPESPRSLIVDHDVTEVKSYEEGDMIWSTKTKALVPAQYVLIEASQPDWNTREVHAIKIRLLPVHKGILNLYIRATFKDSQNELSTDPPEGKRDQQGYPVKHYQILVK